ncbi:orotidine 5'-phosphate decarboxylase [Candidatus Woesearchaeota archaeon]|nr:orotidine 5'-phosphate decarboxylase [Candidatus Woesearchaeota archaeon]
MTSFREKWLAAVEQKNSVLCAGLDPAESAMGRGDEGLSEKDDKLTFGIRYLEAVSPYCSAVKPNVQYWKGEPDMEFLAILSELAKELGLVVIDDSKLADIGSTNDAGLYHAKQKGFDAVTLAAFAGNIKEAAEQAKKRDIGLISMCLMSNPEYESVKNQWVRVEDMDSFPNSLDTVEIQGVPHVRKYIQLAHDAARHGLDGIVIGAPSKKNHLKDEEIFAARAYSRDDTLVLLPGVGAQGGEASAIWNYFDPNNVIVNVGRAVMFPNGSKSTLEQQAEAAKHYQKMLNELRTK